MLLWRTNESGGSREVELSRIGDGCGRLLLGVILLVGAGQVNERIVHDATDNVLHFRGLEVIAKSVLANVPSVIVRKNLGLEIDRVGLSRGQIFSVDDLVGSLDGEHKLSIAEHRNKLAGNVIVGNVVLGEKLCRSFPGRRRHGEKQLERFEMKVCVQLCKVATTLICETRSCVLRSETCE